MRSRTAGVGDELGTRGAAIVGTCARHRFALAGFGVAIAVGVCAPALARASSVALEGTLVLLLAPLLVGVGFALGRRFDALRATSLQDPMTRVGNRRHWDERLREELERAVRSRMPLSLLLVDVDHLKGLNDLHGHVNGDRALALVGDVLRDTCRSRDVAARYGGDEFAILLPRTRLEEAKVVAERIRQEVRRRRTSLGAPLASLLTVSIGVVDLESVREPRADLLFDCADQALYLAKENGRDRIEVKGRAFVSGVISLDERRNKRDARGALGA